MLKLRTSFPDGPIAPDEVWVSIVGETPPGQSHPPTAYVVRRGDTIVGRLLDWTEYPPARIAVKDPVLGYILPGRPGVASYVYGIERLVGEKFIEDDAAWKDRRKALESLLGEPLALPGDLR